MRIYISTLILFLLFISCKGENKLSDHDQIEKNVREYFFMGDSVTVNVTLTDTIFVDELDAMITNAEDNNRLISAEIDTLQSLVDMWNYRALDFEKNNQTDSASSAKINALEYTLKLRETEFHQAALAQSVRIFMRLKRSAWANITGFEANVHYELEDESNDIIILMDANFEVVD